MEHKRLTLFAGHYGSGKTNIAVNYALLLAKEGKKVSIADLDIVNPYFRTKDSEKELAAMGVDLICSAYANSNVDLPAIPAESYRLVQDRSRFGVVDIGGDDRGAYALGRYETAIREENDYEMLFVFNVYRPLTPDAQSALEVMREIETAGKIKFTAIVNNSNLGVLTTKEDVLASVESAEELARLSGLPIKMTTVSESLVNSFNGEIDNIFPLKLQKKIV